MTDGSSSNSGHEPDRKEPSLSLLIKLMKMTTSKESAEALAFLRRANHEADKFGGWEAILTGKVTVIGDPFADLPPLREAQPAAPPCNPRPPPPPQQPFTPAPPPRRPQPMKYATQPKPAPRTFNPADHVPKRGKVDASDLMDAVPDKKFELHFCKIERATMKAYLVEFDFGRTEWIPKSQATFDNANNLVTVPEWIVADKKLHSYIKTPGSAP